MGMILMPGGCGGIDLDVVTATAGDILSGKVIVGADGEPLTGILALSGNAGTGDVLSGKTFYSNDAKTKLAGTMTNQGAKTASINCGGSYTIPAGYHNGSGKVTANSLSSQTSGTASVGDILTGKTAWVNGNKLTGTMKNYSSAIQTATTSASDQTKSCYRINNGYVEVVPAIGYWGIWDWAKSCIRIAINNLASNVVKIVSGTQNSSGSHKITWGGSSYTSTAINVNPGGVPIAAFAADMGRTDTFVIRFMSTYFVCGGFNRNYNVGPSSCSWTSSSVVLPIGSTNSHSMTYYIAVLK